MLKRHPTLIYRRFRNKKLVLVGTLFGVFGEPGDLEVGIVVIGVGYRAFEGDAVS